MSKLGALGRGIGCIFSFITSIIYTVLQYVALTVSLVVAVYTVGDYTMQAISDKKMILDTVYWRDPKRSGIALGLILFGVYLFSRLTILSLLAYGALGVLGAAIAYRVYKLGEAQIKKTDCSNPFKTYLEQEVTVPQERIHAQVDVLVEHGQNIFKHLRHLFLIENLVDSAKFGLLLYTLTYIGNWFSGLSLVLIFVITLFSVPKVYELYKEPIDKYLNVVQENLEKVQHAIEEKLPFLKKVSEGEKKEQ